MEFFVKVLIFPQSLKRLPDRPSEFVVFVARGRPAAEHVEIVADAVQLRQPCGDEHRAALRAELQDQLAEHEGALDIESAKGLVEQQDPFGIQQQQDQRQPFPLRCGKRRGLRVERYGQAAEHSRGIRSGVVTDREVETVARRQSGPEARFRLRKTHVAPPQGMP
ncbi:MAG: hypothetical protein ACLUNN_10960, partial [Alistipes finegoldii]